MKISQLLYSLARLSRDAKAIQKGPKAIIKRQVRRTVYQKVNGQTARFLNRLMK